MLPTHHEPHYPTRPPLCCSLVEQPSVRLLLRGRCHTARVGIAVSLLPSHQRVDPREVGFTLHVLGQRTGERLCDVASLPRVVANHPRCFSVTLALVAVPASATFGRTLSLWRVELSTALSFDGFFRLDGRVAAVCRPDTEQLLLTATWDALDTPVPRRAIGRSLCRAHSAVLPSERLLQSCFSAAIVRILRGGSSPGVDVELSLDPVPDMEDAPITLSARPVSAACVSEAYFAAALSDAIATTVFMPHNGQIAEKQQHRWQRADVDEGQQKMVYRRHVVSSRKDVLWCCYDNGTPRSGTMQPEIVYLASPPRRVVPRVTSGSCGMEGAHITVVAEGGATRIVRGAYLGVLIIAHYSDSWAPAAGISGTLSHESMPSRCSVGPLASASNNASFGRSPSERSLPAPHEDLETSFGPPGISLRKRRRDGDLGNSSRQATFVTDASGMALIDTFQYPRFGELTLASRASFAPALRSPHNVCAVTFRPTQAGIGSSFSHRVCLIDSAPFDPTASADNGGGRSPLSSFSSPTATTRTLRVELATGSASEAAIVALFRGDTLLVSTEVLHLEADSRRAIKLPLTDAARLLERRSHLGPEVVAVAVHLCVFDARNDDSTARESANEGTRPFSGGRLVAAAPHVLVATPLPLPRDDRRAASAAAEAEESGDIIEACRAAMSIDPLCSSPHFHKAVTALHHTVVQNRRFHGGSLSTDDSGEVSASLSSAVDRLNSALRALDVPVSWMPSTLVGAWTAAALRALTPEDPPTSSSSAIHLNAQRRLIQRFNSLGVTLAVPMGPAATAWTERLASALSWHDKSDPEPAASVIADALRCGLCIGDANTIHWVAVVAKFKNVSLVLNATIRLLANTGQASLVYAAIRDDDDAHRPVRPQRRKNVLIDRGTPLRTALVVRNWRVAAWIIRQYPQALSDEDSLGASCLTIAAAVAPAWLLRLAIDAVVAENCTDDVAKLIRCALAAAETGQRGPSVIAMLLSVQPVGATLLSADAPTPVASSQIESPTTTQSTPLGDGWYAAILCDSSLDADDDRALLGGCGTPDDPFRIGRHTPLRVALERCCLAAAANYNPLIDRLHVFCGRTLTADELARPAKRFGLIYFTIKCRSPPQAVAEEPYAGGPSPPSPGASSPCDSGHAEEELRATLVLWTRGGTPLPVAESPPKILLTTRMSPNLVVLPCRELTVELRDTLSDTLNSIGPSDLALAVAPLSTDESVAHLLDFRRRESSVTPLSSFESLRWAATARPRVLGTSGVALLCEVIHIYNDQRRSVSPQGPVPCSSHSGTTRSHPSTRRISAATAKRIARRQKAGVASETGRDVSPPQRKLPLPPVATLPDCGPRCICGDLQQQQRDTSPPLLTVVLYQGPCRPCGVTVPSGSPNEAAQEVTTDDTPPQFRLINAAVHRSLLEAQNKSSDVCSDAVAHSIAWSLTVASIGALSDENLALALHLLFAAEKVHDTRAKNATDQEHRDPALTDQQHREVPRPCVTPIDSPRPHEAPVLRSSSALSFGDSPSNGRTPRSSDLSESDPLLITFFTIVGPSLCAFLRATQTLSAAAAIDAPMIPRLLALFSRITRVLGARASASSEIALAAQDCGIDVSELFSAIGPRDFDFDAISPSLLCLENTLTRLLVDLRTELCRTSLIHCRQWWAAGSLREAALSRTGPHVPLALRCAATLGDVEACRLLAPWVRQDAVQEPASQAVAASHAILRSGQLVNLVLGAAIAP